jgi:hypothetical protein
MPRRLCPTTSLATVERGGVVEEGDPGAAAVLAPVRRGTTAQGCRGGLGVRDNPVKSWMSLHFGLSLI